MDAAEVAELVKDIEALDVAHADRVSIAAAVAQVQRLTSWCEARQLAHATALAQVAAFPEKAFADAARTNLRGASRVFERVDTVTAVTGLTVALGCGDVTGEYVDVVGRALRSLQPDQRPHLVANAAELVGAARQSSLDEFARVVRDEVRRIEADNGASRLQRQQRATGLRGWFDKQTGMWKLSGEFDPALGLKLAGRLDNKIASLFSEAVPDTCPCDPVAKQDHLRALALVALTEDPAAGSGRAEVIVVVDTTQSDAQGVPSLDWGIPVEVPLRVLEDLAGEADISTIVVRNGVVLHAPGRLDLGRTTRIANRAQRRALCALHATCVVPGCDVPFEHCKIHHVVWWRHGGKTDLANLMPLCVTHHHRVHDDNWRISLAADRALTMHLPDSTVLKNGPPPPLRRTAAR